MDIRIESEYIIEDIRNYTGNGTVEKDEVVGGMITLICVEQTVDPSGSKLYVTLEAYGTMVTSAIEDIVLRDAGNTYRVFNAEDTTPVIEYKRR